MAQSVARASGGRHRASVESRVGVRPCGPAKLRVRGRVVTNAKTVPGPAEPAGGREREAAFPPRWISRGVRSVEKQLANLQLAIAQLALLAFLSALGTVIKQNQTLPWYQANYPDGDSKVLGFLDYQLLIFLQLDHIYTSVYFLGLIALLGASIIACSKSQQWPIVRIAQRWRFATTPKKVFAKDNSWTLPLARIRDLGHELRARNYQVFVREGALYAFKGIAGRFAPLTVHASLIMILFGAAYGALAGFEAQVMLPEGTQVLMADIMKGASTSIPGVPLPEGALRVLRLKQFHVDYRSDGSVAQYRSTLALEDVDGREDSEKEIYVNEPMRFKGVTIYQADWAISSIQLRVRSSDTSPYVEVNPGMVELGDALGMNSSTKLYGTYIPLELLDGNGTPKGISILAKDMESAVIYDTQGRFAGVRRAGSGTPIVIEGQTIILDRIVGASGLSLKHDPGVAFVYAGFGFLMITTIVSYTSHSQVWALQEDEDLHVGGRTNRAKVGFQQELNSVLDALPMHGSAPAGPPAPPSSLQCTVVQPPIGSNGPRQP